MKYRKHTGISLIEVIFVVLIIAIVAIGAVRTMRKFTNERLEREGAKAATRVARAAESYFLRENLKWPATIDDLVSRGYLTQKQTCTPWVVTQPKSYCKCGSKSCYSLWLPDTISSSNYIKIVFDAPNKNTASEVAALLPSSKTSSSVSVSTTVPIPGPRSLPNGLIIKEIEMKRLDGYTNISRGFSCPPGWGKNFQAMLNSIRNTKTFKLGGSITQGTQFRENIGPISRAEVIPKNNGDNPWDEDRKKDDWQLRLQVESVNPTTGFEFDPLNPLSWVEYATPIKAVTGFITNVVDGIHSKDDSEMALIIKYCIPPDYDPYMHDEDD